MARPSRLSLSARDHRQQAPDLSARPMEEMTTQVVAPVASRIQRRRGPFAFMRTLRWRLALTYAGLFAVLLLILGLVLNGIIGRVLYAEGLESFKTDTTATVSTSQRRFDLDVLGTQPGCVGATSYQQAFQEADATPLINTGASQVYLLDRLGNVLAPENAATVVGDPGPYLQAAALATLRREVTAAGAPTSTGVIASTDYQITGGPAQRVGVVLVAVRYHSASTCVNRRNAAIGIVEVVTYFPRVQRIMDTVHLVLALSILAVLALVAVTAGPLAAQALRPLTRMTRTAQRIAAGDLSQRVRLPHGGDEIGRLADTFDEMIARIEVAFEAQQASEERMRQFIADASHELRTPLTSIRGYTDVLLRGAKDDPATAEQVLLATRREAERMTRLVTDLLTLARLDTGRPLQLQSVDAIALTGEAVDQARILAGEREVALRTDGLGRLSVLADPDRLKQVLLVLLDNALKYGGQTPDGWVRVQVWRNNRTAFVSVGDNGPGIASQDLPHIFDRFYRVERGQRNPHIRRRTPDIAPAAPAGNGATMPAIPAGEREQGASPSAELVRGLPSEGAGLGLAIAQAIIRAHGGSLTVQSELGVGTTFTVSLPTAGGTAPQREMHV